LKPVPETSARLSRWHKRAVIWTSLTLAVTGVLWMAAHYAMLAFPDLDEPPMRSVMHGVLIVHGVLAYGAAILLGSLLGRHIPAGLRRKNLPLSGLVSLALGAGLIVSALFLYYAPSPEIHDIASLAHQALGVVAIAAVCRHIFVWSERAPAARAPRRDETFQQSGETNRRSAPAL
jgi:hypothetical protein